MRPTPNQIWRHRFEQTAPGCGLADRIVRMLLAAMHARVLVPGSTLPATRELAVELGVGRNTVLRALNTLVDAGWLAGRERSSFMVLAVPPPPAAPGDRPQPPCGPDWSARLALHPSRQRNIAKPPDLALLPYAFAFGQMDPTLFRHAEWRACHDRALRGNETRGLLDDLCDRDDPLLVEQIRTRLLPRRGVWARDDEILVTVGAQQALYMLAQLLVAPGARVGIEDPGYPDARNILSLRGATVVPLAVDAQGAVPDTPADGCTLVCMTPSHQCPTMVTMPLARRQQWLERARRDGTVLVEDDYDPEHRWDGPPTPALKSLDESGHVVYVGSLSKSLAPGLRLGYVVADRALIAELRALRRLMVRHPATVTQRTMALFLAEGHLDVVAQRMRHAFRLRARELADALARELPDWQRVPLSGGSAQWVRLPTPLQGRSVAERLLPAGVYVEPGDVFFADPAQGRQHLRMGFSSIPIERIAPGVRRIRELLQPLSRPALHAS